MELALWGKKWFGIDHLKTTHRRSPVPPLLKHLTVMAKTMNELGKRLADEGMKFAHLCQDRIILCPKGGCMRGIHEAPCGPPWRF